MIGLFVAVTLMCGATSAAALSCLQTSPAQMFNDAAEAPQDYVVLYGSATFDTAALPPAVLGPQDEAPTGPTLLPASFEGHLLTEDGFTAPYAGPLTLHAACAGSWCGRIDSPARLLAFALNTNNGPVLVVDPCASTYILDPGRAALTTVVACMQGGACQ